MGRLQLTVVECKYKEIDTQLKEQPIHGLNDNEMLVEIIRKHTKMKENKNVTKSKSQDGKKEQKYKEPNQQS